MAYSVCHAPLELSEMLTEIIMEKRDFLTSVIHPNSILFCK